MEHYGWCVGALWVVCGSIRERNYRLKKKNYLSGPTVQYVCGENMLALLLDTCPVNLMHISKHRYCSVSYLCKIL